MQRVLSWDGYAFENKHKKVREARPEARSLESWGRPAGGKGSKKHADPYIHTCAFADITRFQTSTWPPELEQRLFEALQGLVCRETEG